MAEQHILAIDPGQVVLGYCLGAFKGQQRSLIDFGSVKDTDPEKLVRWLDAILGARWPHLVAIESYDYQGPERSHNRNAFTMSGIAGGIQTAVLMWSRRANDSLTQVIMVSKNDANATLGLTGKCSKDRVKRAIDAVFPGNRMANQHERDAALVMVAGRTRSGRTV